MAAQRTPAQQSFDKAWHIAKKRMRQAHHPEVTAHAENRSASKPGPTIEGAQVKPKVVGTGVNNVAGNPRQGSQFRVMQNSKGQLIHRYAAEAGGIPRQDVVVKASNAQNKANPEAMKKLAQQMMKQSKKPRRG